MAFLGASDLLIDNFGSFGVNVGTSSYAGPQLQGFAPGDMVDLKSFAPGGAALQFNPLTGVLQVTNGSGQAASLSFQLLSLGGLTFTTSGDGGSGTLIMRA